MAIGDAYATVQDYRALTGKSSTDQDLQLQGDLLAVSRLLDRLTGHVETGFNKDEAAVKRIFLPDPYAPDAALLFVPPLAAAPVSVKIDTDGDGLFTDETALAATDYQRLPLNAAAGPIARPWTALRLTRWAATYASWPQHLHVEVDAVWGWPAVPDMVRRATVELVAILRIESPRATSQVNELQNVLEVSSAGQRVVRDLVATLRPAAAMI